MDSHKFDFSDIAPVNDCDFQAKMAKMVEEPGFIHAVKWVMPDVDYPQFAELLKTIKDKETFQHKIMLPFMEMLANKTTAGVSYSGGENLEKDNNYTFITNHRDIVLDASFLNLCMLRIDRRAAEVAIGNNLLIFDWIDTLVRLNKSFIVKRDLKQLEALNGAKQLSAYISHAINDKHESVWIAQREGRAKDSSDHTQESLIKMLSLEDGDSYVQNLAQKNICPVAIAYEYDPNDYLKAREFLLKRRDPAYKKTQRDDLFSMETGLLQFKGRVHFSIGKCITPQIEALPADIDRHSLIRKTCEMIDTSIHSGYKIYPINYIAHDLLLNTNTYEAVYTPEERKAFVEHIDSQLAKVDVENVTDEERDYMHHMVYTMYANPLINKVKATNSSDSNPIA